MLPVSLWHHGTKISNMLRLFKDGYSFVKMDVLLLRQINFINPSLNMVLLFLNIYFEK